MQTYDLTGLRTTRPPSAWPGQNRTDVDFRLHRQSAGVNLVKTGPATAKVGDTITYHFKVTNTGNTYLYGGVTINDPMLGGAISGTKTPVAPGEVNEFCTPYVVKSTDPDDSSEHGNRHRLARRSAAR